MPALIKRLTREGLVDVEFHAANLHDATKYEPRAGVYTVSNTYQRTKTLLLDAHLARLEDSARRQGIPLVYDRARLKTALRRMIVEADYGDVRFRISVPAAAPDEMILSVEPFQPPSAELINGGVRCITSTAVRHDPAAKSSDWLHRRQALEAARPSWVYETILIDPTGRLLEGASSNVYAIIDGELRTAGSGVLAGISRMILLEVCERVLPLRLQAPNAADIKHFAEAFLSSSSRGIIPVIEVDGMPIGAGDAGPRTLALRNAYQRWVGDHLEELC